MTSRIQWGDDTVISWTAVFPLWVSPKNTRLVGLFANRFALADAALIAPVQPSAYGHARINFKPHFHVEKCTDCRVPLDIFPRKGLRA